jgi:hypothetical protein
LDPRLLAYLLGVRALDFATEHRAPLDNRVQHTGHGNVDTEHRFAGIDGAGVHPGLRLADNAKFLRVLELDRFQVGRRKLGRPGGQIAVGRGATGFGMHHLAAVGRALGLGHTPVLRCRRDEHLAIGRANASQRVPVHGSRHAAPGKLRTEGLRVDAGLLDFHAFPIDVKFLGYEHGQHGLHTLADLWVLGHDGDHAIGADANECHRRIGRRFARGLRKRPLLLVEAQREGAARKPAHLQKRSPV